MAFSQPNIQIMREMITEVPLILDAALDTVQTRPRHGTGRRRSAEELRNRECGNPVLMAEAIENMPSSPDAPHYLAGRMPRKNLRTQFTMQGIVCGNNA